jgi:HSP20 family molecular chaperone IbpA
MPDTQHVAQRTAEAGQQPGTDHAYHLVPPADILEDGGGITLRLDMPGVSRDRLRLEADRDTLLIEGEMQIAMAPDMTPLYADIQSTRFSRSFTLSGELDAEKISASLVNGVLAVKIPLRSELKPRKIEVQVS